MKKLWRVTLGLGLALALVLAGCAPAPPEVAPEEEAPAVTGPSVTVEDKGTHWEVVMDYTTGKTPYEMGKELGEAIIQAFPDYPATLDGWYACALRGAEGYMLVCSQRFDSVEVDQKYLDELEGLADGLGLVDETSVGDGQLSRDELFVLNYYADVLHMWECTAIGVWGERSKTGDVLTSRTLGLPTSGCKAFLGELNSVLTVKDGKKSFCSVGLLGFMGLLTAFKPNGLYMAVLDCGLTQPKHNPEDEPHPVIVPADYSRTTSSICFSARYALENFSTIDEIGDYLTAKDYHWNHLWFVADTEQAKVIENNISGPEGWTGKPLVRDVETELNPGVEPWVLDDSGIPDTHSIGVVNSFVAKGNYDNHTTHPRNVNRWHSQIEQLKQNLEEKGGKLDLSDLESIQTYYQGDKPGSIYIGDLYNYDWRVYTAQVYLFCPNTLELWVFFENNQVEDGLPLPPVFEKVSPRF